MPADGLPSNLRKRPRFILVTDLDWTLIDHTEAPEFPTLRALNELWDHAFSQDCLFVYSTGRSHVLYNELLTRYKIPLRSPDVLVCSVGTEIFFETTGEPLPDTEWVKHLDAEGWNRDKAQEVAKSFPELHLQGPREQRPHKISFWVKVPGTDEPLPRDQALPILSSLQAQLDKAGLKTHLTYSGGIDLDILPVRASKGKALEYLLHQVEQEAGSPTEGVLVCGDSGNDIELFKVPGVRGCVVSNAHHELQEFADENSHLHNIFKATKPCAAGILQALQHFKLIPDEAQLTANLQQYFRVQKTRDAQGIASDTDYEQAKPWEKFYASTLAQAE